MKTIIFSVALMLVALGSNALPGSITNTLVVQRTGAEERVVDIQFDLVGSAAEYDISLDVSFDNGTNYVPVDPDEISGLLTVPPGTGIQLVWDGRLTYGTVYAEMTRIRITATPIGTQTQVVEVTNSTTGKTWMDRNLGATRAATSSTDPDAYGDLFQWGRLDDGHQDRVSTTTSTLSTTDVPGHGNFILPPDDPFDWRNPKNNDLWQGVDGINNPCPSGYRLPTEAELNEERLSWSSNDSDGAFASPLKWPMAGSRSGYDGSLINEDRGLYRSSTVGESSSRILVFHSSDAYMSSSARSHGYSVRCIKD